MSIVKPLLKDYKLLPQNFERERLNMMVVDSLEIKGLPIIKTVITKDNELQNTQDIKSKCCVIGTKVISKHEKVSFINKLKPHAIFELMAFSAGADIKPAFEDHSKQFRLYISRSISKFANFARSQGLTPVVSWSYDPYTHDRNSLQGEKRFHVHMVGRRTRGLQYIIKHLTSFRNITTSRRRRICDEYTVVVSRIAYELLKSANLKQCVLLTPGETQLSNVLLQLRLNHGWNGFKTHELQKDIMVIEKTINRIQKTLLKGTTRGTPGIWRRPKLKSESEIEKFISQNQLDISLSTRQLVLHFYKQLIKQPTIDDSKISDYPKKIITYLYPLAGPAHSTTFSEVDGDVYVHIRPALFSDLGGAGVCIINGAIIKLRKGVGTFSKTEVLKREEFQKNLLRELIK